MLDILQTTFSNAFLKRKYILIRVGDNLYITWTNDDPVHWGMRPQALMNKKVYFIDYLSLFTFVIS